MRLRLFGLVLTGLVALTACGGGGGGGGNEPEPPPTGTLGLTVVEADTETAIAGARVVVIDGDTGQPIDVLITDENGKASKVYNTGPLQLKVSSQGYDPSPAPGIPPLPVQIVKDQTTSITVDLFPITDGAARGTISGTVTNTQGQPVAGALVVAVSAADGTTVVGSTTAGPDGSYILYNVPEGDVVLDTFIGGLNFDRTGTVTVVADTQTDQPLAAAGVAGGRISGHVSFLAISGSTIDITLVHPGTREVLPKLRTYTSGQYEISGVPDGTFDIVASLENDGYVLDPDSVVKFGVPQVTIVAGGSITGEDFDVTGSIELTNPALKADGSVPELSDTPTFTWVKNSSYASATDYAIEVVDESGTTVWGGFSLNTSTGILEPSVTVAQGNNPSIVYAGPSLTPGRYYQLRVYARDVLDAAGNFKLLSASETLDGLFKVAQPAP